MTDKHIAIIGGGISGLACAHRLTELAREQGRPIRVTLLEAGDRLGGVIHTVKDDGYLCEAGPENFVTNKPWGMALCKRLDLNDQIAQTNDKHRRAMIVRGGKLVPIPEGFLLLAPTRIWPMVVTPLFSWPGKMRMAMDYIIPRKRGKDHDESLASFVRRRFGQQALDRAIQPLIGGIYTADPETLSLRATMPMFLDMERKYGSVIRAMRKNAKQRGKGASSGARYSLFVTLQNGLCDLVDTIAGRLENTDICTSTRVRNVSRQNDTWTIDIESGEPLRADAVVVTGPAHVASAMLHGVDMELSRQLGSIQYASSAVVHFAYKRSDVPHPLDAFGFVVPAVENRKILAASFSSVKFDGRAPRDMALIRVFMGGAMQPRMMALNDERLLAAARDELKTLMNIQAAPQRALVHRWEKSMPQYAVGHLDLVADIRQRVSRHAGLELAGNGYAGVGIPDCIHSGEQAAENLLS
jgi:oxygen-dependent protoporphyrinogen oxidase